jgi:hypothetical protein
MFKCYNCKGKIPLGRKLWGSDFCSWECLVKWVRKEVLRQAEEGK